MSRTLNVAVPDRLGWLTGGALVGVLSAVLVGPALGPVRTRNQSEKPEHTLTVSGTGIVTVKPDVATSPWASPSSATTHRMPPRMPPT